MIKRKLVLKKQVIASLSDLEKSKVLGGAEAAFIETRVPSGCICDPSVTLPCDSDACSLKSECCPTVVQ